MNLSNVMLLVEKGGGEWQKCEDKRKKCRSNTCYKALGSQVSYFSTFSGTGALWTSWTPWTLS